MSNKKEIKFFSPFVNEDYFFLSNFYKRVFYTIEDEVKIKWKTSEHYYQYKKLKFLQQFPENKILDSDLELLINADTPRQAKDIIIYRKFKYFDEWDKIKANEMKQVLLAKFNIPFMKKILIETGDAILIENSPYDYYWGCGADKSGKNMLGLLLMEVREELKQTNW